MRTLTAMSIAAFLAISGLSQESKLPPPPDGFKWEWCEEIKGAFLKPDGWFVKKVNKGDTFACFISKEKIEGDKQFKTGFSCNVLKKLGDKIPPMKFAIGFREDARSTNKFENEWTKDMGPFKSFGFLYTKDDPQGKFTVHNLLIANEKIGTLYMITFEAPTNEWAEAWKKGEPILAQLMIDDET